MNLKKNLYTLIIASAALFAYNNIDSVKAETVPVKINNETPASISAEESTAENQIEETKETSPFDNKIETISEETTTKTQINIEDIEPAVLMELKPEVKEIIQERTTIKETVTESGETVEIQEKRIDNVKVEENKVTDTITEEVKVQEVKKEEELPVLEEIELPTLNKKPINNEPVKIEVSSQRIPAGTVIPLRLESSINSIASDMGDQFNATLTSDIMVGDNIVLPAGTVVRGTVGKMQKAGMFVKEAKILLVFDHIVTPVGKQIPVFAYMTGSPKINYEGYITGGTSYGKAFKEDASKSKDIIVNSTTFGVDKGLAYLGGVPVVITAPLCAIGGTIGGGGYLIGKSIYNIFNKGGEVLLEPGTLMNVTLSKAMDVPVN